ncbi:hypothetical protein MKX01_014595 [Papaver californicum]|nr:hypothetical protein MKX01_014595 [Papaver californicum]
MLYVLISSSFISTTYYVDGKKNISKAEAEDEIEIESQLRVLNKKPVKTITSEVGDIIDCIDIYKQPAFDNPLLKDHKIQMNPSSIPGETTNKTVSSSSIFRGLQKERCPSGTVPIRRTTREDLLNAKYFAKKAKPIHADSHPNIGFHFVTAEEIIPGKKYFGGAASMSIHNLAIDPDQFSTSQIWIVNASHNQMNSIEFGIMKHPTIFGDSLTRLFGYWTADGHQATGCYNMLCPGFIQISQNIFFGHQFTQSSIYGQISYDVHLMVHRAQDTGHWWLRMGPTAEIAEDVGYWPSEIFTLLASSASAVRYGAVAAATVQASTPRMGNGFLPQLQDYDRTAYMRLMKYVNEAGEAVNLDSYTVRTNRGTVPQCYDIMFAGQIGGDWDNTIVYGGPGGICA